LEQWRAEVIRLHGLDFFNTLASWRPTVPEEAVLCAAHLVQHAESYHMPLPPELTPSPGAQVIANPLLQREMMAKFVETKIQALKELLDFQAQSTSDAPATAEFAARYMARTNRAAEAAVRWFVFLDQNDL
jgi:hypothetical protein